MMELNKLRENLKSTLKPPSVSTDQTKIDALKITQIRY